MIRKTYLGDGAYAVFEGHAIVLTAENGFRATDSIVVEPEIFASLIRYAATHSPVMRGAVMRLASRLSEEQEEDSTP